MGHEPKPAPWIGTTAGDWSRNSSGSLAKRWFMRMRDSPSPAMKRMRDFGYLSRIVFISWRTSAYDDCNRSNMGGMWAPTWAPRAAGRAASRS
eukprot:scaffold44934_cov104-Phaeocystis_antarctica.AAC.1